jgi:hypothetical protein
MMHKIESLTLAPLVSFYCVARRFISWRTSLKKFNNGSLTNYLDMVKGNICVIQKSASICGSDSFKPAN